MELLIRTRDKATDDPMASKAGDVIAACPDGWAWTAAERASPDWTIVRVDLLPVEVDALLATRMAQGQIVARRAQRIDVARLTRRRQGEDVAVMTRRAVVATVVTADTVDAPAHLGGAG